MGIGITFLAVADGINKMNEIGNTILYVFQTVGFWVVGIRCCSELLKLAASHDKKSMINVILSNVILYAAMFMIPWIFGLIKEVFGGK